MKENEEKKQEVPKITWKAWLSLIFLIILFSGVFKDFAGPLKAFDFLNLQGSFGKIFEDMTFIGKEGSGAREGFLTALTIIPSICFAVGIIEIVEQYDGFRAAEKLFTPILKPILGIPGACGIAFVSSFTSSDIGAVMTKQLYEDGLISDDERSIFAGYQYAGSAVILNTINTQAPLLPIIVLPVGAIILFLIACKIIGANFIRLVLNLQSKKKGALQ